MEYKIRFFLTFLLFALYITISGQTVQHSKIEYIPQDNLLKAGTSEFLSEAIEVPIQNPEPFLAIGLNATISIEFESEHFQMRVSVDGDNWSDWQRINDDDEAGKVDSKFLGRLLFFDKSTKFMQFRTNKFEYLEKLTFSFISPGKTDESKIEERVKKSHLGKNAAGIDRPEFVSRKSWGCPQDEHVSTRSLTNVTHLIIHHSAGSTTSSDFAAVVRSY